MKQVAQARSTADHFVVGFGAMVGVGWLVMMSVLSKLCWDSSSGGVAVEWTGDAEAGLVVRQKPLTAGNSL